MAIKIPDPYKDPRAWEQIVFLLDQDRFVLRGGLTVAVKPGTARIDEQTVPGENSAYRVVMGFSDSTANIDINIYESAAIAEFQRFIGAVYNQGKAAPYTMSVLHPNLTLAGMRQCFLNDIEIGDFTLEDGLPVKFGLIEHLDTISKKAFDEKKKKIESANALKKAGANGPGKNDGQLSNGTGGTGSAQANPPSTRNPQSLMPAPLNKGLDGWGDGSNKAIGVKKRILGR